MYAAFSDSDLRFLANNEGLPKIPTLVQCKLRLRGLFGSFILVFILTRKMYAQANTKYYGLHNFGSWKPSGYDRFGQRNILEIFLSFKKVSKRYFRSSTTNIAREYTLSSTSPRLLSMCVQTFALELDRNSAMGIENHTWTKLIDNPKKSLELGRKAEFTIFEFPYGQATYHTKSLLLTNFSWLW